MPLASGDVRVNDMMNDKQLTRGTFWRSLMSLLTCPLLTPSNMARSMAHLCFLSSRGYWLESRASTLYTTLSQWQLCSLSQVFPFLLGLHILAFIIYTLSLVPCYGAICSNHAPLYEGTVRAKKHPGRKWHF